MSLNISSDQLAFNIVQALKRDMEERRGFRQNWEQIDTDIQREIEDEWHRIVQHEIEQAER